MAVNIKYKGVDIGTVEPGKAVKIKCAGKKMKTDVSVAVEALKLQDKTATANGTIKADEGFDGLSKVTVNVPGGSTLKKFDGTVVIE